MMSSQDIIFVRCDGLEPGMAAEVVVAWPFLLDGHIRLQLMLDATITSSHDGAVQARIKAYDFRTAGSAEAGRELNQAPRRRMVGISRQSE